MKEKVRKLTPWVWEIPKGARPEMRVPARIYASEKLVRESEDEAFKQLTNVACLPGIVRYVIGMPDMHTGYGLPMGAVGAFDVEKGVLSSGCCGYDINCLPGSAQILCEHGCRIPISMLEKKWLDVKCIDLRKRSNTNAIGFRFFKRFSPTLIKIRTFSGQEILVTHDHPLLTPRGMVNASDLKEGDLVGIYPFRGVEYEEPDNKVILTEEEVRGSGIPNSGSVVKELKEKGLLPLRRDSKTFPLLVKLLAYNLGDGTLYFNRGRGYARFYGRKEDLELVRKDIRKLGFKPSKILTRKRKHSIQTKKGRIEFVSIESSVTVCSKSFVTLLYCLGAPLGRKVDQDFLIPSPILDSPCWIQRLFLAAFFDAEMSSPQTLTTHEYNFYMPHVSINKSLETKTSGVKFLQQIATLLKNFGISSTIEEKEVYTRRERITQKISLYVHSNPENLIKFYELVGFEYNQRKKFLANLALHYLRCKQKILEIRKKAQQLAVEVYKKGTRPKGILEALNSEFINQRFVERSLWEGRKTERICEEFQAFEEFCKQASKALGRSGAVWDKIVSKEEIEFNDWVYDFTVAHPSHNFIANCFVVSNCGVRLIKTNLDASQVRPKISQLIETLFKNVPSGVGATGRLRVSMDELDEVLVKGARWAVENGYGIKEDLERIEEYGCIEGANPAKVSSTAKSRGRPQLGTLGAGNHFLEVEVVDRIFEPEIAKVFGIEKVGQVLVLLHCGSRGLGHQVADDYLRYHKAAARKYGIRLPDPQLVCAPAQSEEGQAYFAAMKAAVNYAFCNRQVMTHWIRESFEQVFGQGWRELQMQVIYDVCHNIVKLEEHWVDGEKRKLYVHRKGATRAFPAEHELVPEIYKKVGHPVLIAGSMGTASYVLVGTEKGMREAFGSSCHGSGRTMSRAAAIRGFRGEEVRKRLLARGIVAKATHPKVLAEETPEAYKDVDEVVKSVHEAGISKKVARMIPLGVAKG